VGSQLSQLVGLLVGGKLPSLHGQDCQHVGWSRSLGSFHLQGKKQGRSRVHTKLGGSSYFVPHLHPLDTVLDRRELLEGRRILVCFLALGGERNSL